MLEIEMKFPLKDFTTIEERLAEWKLSPKETRNEADYYFNAPDRDFGVTDEALRVRCIGDHNRVTYKGPRQKGVAKIRKEIELAFANGDDAAAMFREMLTSLNFRPVAVVRKSRRIFRFERDGFGIEITLDEVSDLGCFTEIEIVASDAEQSKAETVVAELARELELSNPEPRSYLEMILEKTT